MGAFLRVSTWLQGPEQELQRATKLVSGRGEFDRLFRGDWIGFWRGGFDRF